MQECSASSTTASWPVTDDGDAAVSGPGVENRTPAILAQARYQPLGQCQVHGADHVPVPVHQPVERAVPQPDDAVVDAARFISLLRQRALYLPAAHLLAGLTRIGRARPERAAQLRTEPVRSLPQGSPVLAAAIRFDDLHEQPRRQLVSSQL